VHQPLLLLGDLVGARLRAFDVAGAGFVAVVGERVVPLDDSGRAVPPALAAKCLKLAAAARATLLGIDAVRLFPRDWRFVAADFCPDLRPGGTPLLDAIAEFLDTPGPGNIPTTPAPDEAKRNSGGFRDLLRLW
jgi:hypothetical protein